tara:strand:+ start:899 stop:1240 length:342 start_codon:yes stop_codon:yes gene_type:complete
MALYIITNKTIKMANNGKGIGPRGLGAPKSMAKYGSMAKQAKKQTEPKTGKQKNTSGIFGGDTILGDENNDGNMVTRAVEKFTKKESGEHARQRSLARGAQKGTFFGLEKLFD